MADDAARHISQAKTVARDRSNNVVGLTDRRVAIERGPPARSSPPL
jgi:hypothetical protein